jgi:hypothetical protein
MPIKLEEEEEENEQALNVMVEWLTVLLRIRQVPGSYLGLEIGYPD